MPSKFLSNKVLRNLLSGASDEEKLYLTQLLDKNQKIPYSHEKLQEEICKCGGHGISNFIRGQGTGYLDIIDDIAKELKIEELIPPYYSANEEELSISHFDDILLLKTTKEDGIRRGVEYAEKVEEEIIIKLLEVSYEKMSPEEKVVFDKKINEVAQRFGSDPSKKLIGTAGLMVLGNLGGFATYTFLTTAMSAISMGTLSFGVYTSATSALSLFLGPVGWAGLGVATLYTLGKPKYQKLIPIVATIGSIRQRIKYEQL